MKKKIFFVLNTNECSGAEAVSFSIIEGLKEKYDFYYVCRKGPINDILNEKNIKWIEISSLSVKEIKRVVKEFKPDLIHAVNYRVSTICALANVKVPMVCHLHNNASWIKHLNANSIGFVYAGIKAKKILTVSNSIENEYIFSKLMKNKFINVSNPVSRDSVLSKVNINDFEKKYDICCVARITTPKNPKLFVNIISELKKKNKDIKVVWVGNGDLKEEVNEYINQKGLKDNIELAGFKKNPYQYMLNSKMFLLTSAWEGYGIAAFEALTLGLPCVVSNVGGLPEIVDNTCGRLCDNKNIEEYTKEIDKLLNDEKYYEKKKKNALNKSKKLENIKEYLKNIKTIYDEIL